MPLTRGTRFGAYEILDALGAGGMGEVYRARDTRLGRDVAIKILPESFAADPDRRMRFEREARTLASLNHPNIAAIYGLEDRGLVMELVEGEDLSERIARGPMPSSDALPIARQIADALEAAHEAGIIHRDLKPANIKVRLDGTVKVLDFGLAKAIDAGATHASAPHDTAPTVTSPAMTAMGLVLGTAAYMSPEQAKGRPVDRRADIWAFGVVLFEMLAGRRLFDAEDMSETLAAVLTRDVTLSAMPAEIPGGLRALVADCLVRDPKKRLRDIGDARLRIEKIEAGGAAADLPPSSAAMNPRQRWLWPGIAAVSLIGALGMTVLHLNRPAPVAPDLVTFEISAQAASALATLSPDGRHVAYTTAPAGDAPSRLWVRSLSTLEARPIPSVDGLSGRFGMFKLGLVWSPDSRFALIVRSGALDRVDVATGEIKELLKIPRSVLAPGAWSRDGVILFTRRGLDDGGSAGIWRVTDTGGATAVQVTQLRPGELWQKPSGFLPDGRRFLYATYSGSLTSDAAIRIGSIDRGPAEQDATSLLSADGPAVYAPALDATGAPLSTGYLLFVRQHGLMAQAFDPTRAVLTSASPVQIASGVGPVVEVSDNGRLLYRRSDENDDPLSELVRFDRKGTLLGKIGPPANYGGVDAVEGGRLATVRTDANEAQHIHIVDPARGAFSRLNPGAPSEYAPAPSPDGTVAYTFSPEGLPRDLYVRAANATDEPRLLVTSGNVKHANAWSPDGRFLIYDEHVPERLQDLMIVGKDGGTPMPYLATEADETFGQFSPNGKWLAYRTTESSRPEVFVRDFAPDRTPAYGAEKVQISIVGGDKPRWSLDGHELFFLQGNALMSVSIGPGAPLKVGAPVKLFDAKPASYMPYDVMPDGSFVFVNQTESLTPTTTALRVLLNWQAAIRR